MRSLSSARFQLGTPITVSAIGQPNLVSAEVTGFTVDHQPLSPPEFVVVGHDKSHRLGRATEVATFQDMTYSAIVRQLAGSLGLQLDVERTTRKLDYVLQAESSLALITELANRLGFDWWVDDDTLHFKPPKTSGSAVLLAIDADLISFSVRATGHRPDSVAVRGSDHKTQQAVEGSATSAEIAPSSTFARLVDKPGAKLGTAKLLSASVAAASAEEAKELSDALMLRSIAGAVTAKGVCYGNGRIKPGVTVDVSGYGPLDGKYHVTEVDHVFRPSIGFQTRFTAGDRRPTTLVDTLAGGNGNGSNPMVTNLGNSSLVIGTVTNIKDPDEKGKIRVKFTGLSDKDESAWARLVSIGGGKKRGMVFIPEVGDEVLVGFENGDIRQPVVFGGLFGAKLDIPKWDVTDGKVGRSSNHLTPRSLSRTGRRRERDVEPHRAHAEGRESQASSRRGPVRSRASQREASAHQDRHHRDRGERCRSHHHESADHQHQRHDQGQHRSTSHRDQGAERAEPRERPRDQPERKGHPGRRHRHSHHQGHVRDDQLMDTDPPFRPPDRSVADPAFIGRGLMFPMGVDHTGSISLTSGPDDLDRSIRVVLATAPGERVMRSQFGCRIWELLFEPDQRRTRSD